MLTAADTDQLVINIRVLREAEVEAIIRLDVEVLLPLHALRDPELEVPELCGQLLAQLRQLLLVFEE